MPETPRDVAVADAAFAVFGVGCATFALPVIDVLPWATWILGLFGVGAVVYKVSEQWHRATR